MPRGVIRAGKERPENRTYSREFVARVKHRYLTHRVLGYHDYRKYIIEALAREFGSDPVKIGSLLQYEGML